MSSLLIRRIIVFVVGFALGAVVAAAFVMLVMPWLGPNEGVADSDFEIRLSVFLLDSFPARRDVHHLAGLLPRHPYSA